MLVNHITCMQQLTLDNAAEARTYVNIQRSIVTYVSFLLRDCGGRSTTSGSCRVPAVEATMTNGFVLSAKIGDNA